MIKIKPKLTFSYELRFVKEHAIIAGVDEAGVGPLAGPVVAAAVVLKPQTHATGRSWWAEVIDSKKLTHSKREQLAREIVQRARSFGIGSATVSEIDELNIFQARMLAMKRAVEKLNQRVSLLLVDGNHAVPNLEVTQHAIVRGDEKILSIACASILAKVTRDNMLFKLHEQFPQYGFNKHKGYPTLFHKEMIRLHGPCEEHRKTFGPVREYAET